MCVAAVCVCCSGVCVCTHVRTWHVTGHAAELLDTREDTAWCCYTHASATRTLLPPAHAPRPPAPPHIYLLTHHREQTRGGGADAEAETWQEVEKQEQEQKRLGAPCPRLQGRQRRSLALHRSFVLDTVTYVTCVCRDLVDCLSLESGTSWGRHA